jgi:hypothetical protein
MFQLKMRRISITEKRSLKLNGNKEFCAIRETCISTVEVRICAFVAALRVHGKLAAV